MKGDLWRMLALVAVLVVVVVLWRLVEVMGAPACWPEGGVSAC